MCVINFKSGNLKKKNCFGSGDFIFHNIELKFIVNFHPTYEKVHKEFQFKIINNKAKKLPKYPDQVVLAE